MSVTFFVRWIVFLETGECWEWMIREPGEPWALVQNEGIGILSERVMPNFMMAYALCRQTSTQGKIMIFQLLDFILSWNNQTNFDL